MSDETKEPVIQPKGAKINQNTRTNYNMDDKTFDRLMDLSMLWFPFLFITLASTPLLKPNEQVMTFIIGASGIFIGYRWGSSKQSAKKDETIAGIANQPPLATTKTGDINLDNAAK